MALGFPLMPTVLGNAALSFVPDRSVSVASRDSVAVFVPMYNERDGARTCLESLLAQTDTPEAIVVSVNGGGDDTYQVVVGTLRRRGYVPVSKAPHEVLDAVVERWLPAGTDGDGADAVGAVIVVDHLHRTGKAESLNAAVACGVVDADRIVLSDGDTVFDQEFVARLREGFYRLTFRGRGRARRAVLEDVAVQSGNVTSAARPGASPTARTISAARRAEYAFGSVLRAGQVVRIGRGRLLGRTRLFTVVGCGFGLRRDLLPLPDTTMTEDHDLTLRAQEREDVRRTVPVAALDARGFRVRRRGSLVPLSEVVPGGEVEFVVGGAARFVQDALMTTQDPTHLSGYLAQVERWHGGAQQNLLERARGPLQPNVAFAVYAALVENLLGIGLLTLLLGSLALNLGNPSLGLPPRVVAVALALDLAVSWTVVALGLARQLRAGGRRWWLPRAVAGAALSAPPYLLLRLLGPAIYVAAALRVVPRHGRRRPLAGAASACAWERPTARARSLSHVLVPSGVAASLLSMATLAHFAPTLNPINVEAWRLTFDAEPVVLEDHAALRLVHVRIPEPAVSALPPPRDGLSRFCDPAYTPNVDGARTPRLGDAGDAERYTPLSGWELVALLRLAPLIGPFDAAVEAYGVPAHLYLRVLLNESYLDPLAVGATDDHGLSQQNGDSLTMLRTLSADARDPAHNPRLFARPFSVYDPDFSACAGAAKLAWALRQPTARSDEHAYALYINPIDGVRGRHVSERHAPLVAPMMELGPLVDRIEDAIAAFEREPEALPRRDRDAVRVLAAARGGSISVQTAYGLAYDLVLRHGLPDREHYRRIVDGMFDGRVVGERR